MKNKSHDAAGARDSRTRDKKARRKAVVLALLLGSLTATSMLLLALAPAPLVPDPARSLYAESSPRSSIDDIFQTPVAVREGRWQYIYIHHSKGSAIPSTNGRDDGLGDHFLVGNGKGCADGEIQVGQLWDEQKPAVPAGAKVSDNCISICVVGDLDQRPPTVTQLEHLRELVGAIQTRCGIRAKDVLMYDAPGSAGGVGRLFPTARFAQYLQR